MTKLPKLPGFRHFMRKFDELSMWTSLPSDHDLPQEAANILSFMPGDSAQKAALVWMLTKGLYDATAARHQLAKYASQKLGRHVYDHEVFSSAAHEADPKLGELYKQELLPLWQEKLEPKHIPVPHGTSEQHIDLKDLNQLLQKHGLEPFTFGGTNGLIEHIENGDWAPPFAIHSPIPGEHHLRNGIDLSNPEQLHDERTGKHFYRFGSQKDPSDRFTPPSEPASYDAKIQTMRQFSGVEIDKILNGAAHDPNINPKTLHWLAANRQNFDKRVVGDKDETRPVGALGTPKVKNSTALANMGFTNKGGGEDFVEAESPEEKEQLKQIVLKGMNIINNQKKDLWGRGNRTTYHGYDSSGEKEPWTEQDMQKMLNDIFNHPRRPSDLSIYRKANDPLVERLVKGFYNGKTVSGPKTNDRNYRATKEFLDFGLPATPKDQIPARLVQAIRHYMKDVPYQDFVKKPVYGEQPVDLEKEIIGQGYKPVGDTTNASSMRFQRGAGDYIIAHKGGNGQWFIRTVVSHEPAEKEKWEGAPLILRSGRFGVGDRLVVPVSPEKRDSIQKDMQRAPQKYGDSDVGGGLLASVKDGAKAGVGLAFKFLQVSNKFDRQAVASRHKPEEYYGTAWGALSNIMGSYMYKYGDPLNHWSKEPRNPEDAKSIYSIMAKHGVQDKAAVDHYLKKFDEYIRHKKEPEAGPDFPPNVIEALLENGYHWRVNYMANRVSQAVAQAIASDAKNKSNQETVGKGGDTLDRMAQTTAGDNQARVDQQQGDPQGKGKIFKKGGDQDAFTKVQAFDPSKVELTLPERSKVSLPFINHRRAKNPQYFEGDAWYKKRYDFTTNKLNASGMVNPVQAIDSAISANFNGNLDNERGAGAIDAIGDFIAEFFNQKLHHKMTDQDLDQIAAIFNNFLKPHAPHSIVSLGRQFGSDVIEPATQISMLPNELGRRVMQRAGEHTDRQTTVTPTNVPAPVQQPAAQPTAPMSRYSSDDDDFDTLPAPVQFAGQSYHTPDQYAKALAASRGTPQEHGLRQAGMNSSHPAYQQHAQQGSFLGRKAESSFISFREWNNWRYVVSKNG
jgi:hypothetical protein